MELTEQHVTRYTINGNTVPYGDRHWRASLVVHIERRGPGLGSDQWRITRPDEVFNIRTGEWDHDYVYRHAEDRSGYFTGLDEAAQLAERLARLPWGGR